jgi:alpha-N-arabinofuranosidase
MENYGRCIYNGVFVGTGSSIPNTSGMRNDVIAGFIESGVYIIKIKARKVVKSERLVIAK